MNLDEDKLLLSLCMLNAVGIGVILGLILAGYRL